MKDEFGKAIFQATFSNLANHIFEKQLQVNKIQLNLMQKLQGKSKTLSSHLGIIKQCRKTVDTLDSVLKEIKDHFSELKISSVYILFDTIFRNLVFSIKVLSQCYLRRFEMMKGCEMGLSIHRNSQQNIKSSQASVVPLCPCKLRQKQNARKLQYLDIQIANIENRENQIQTQMHALMPNLLAQKEKVQMIIDSTCKYEMFQEVQKVFSEISHKSEYFFGSFLKGINDFDQKQNNYVKPSEIDDVIHSEKRQQAKKVAKQKLQEIIVTIQTILKEKLQKKIEQNQTQVQKIIKEIAEENVDLTNSETLKRKIRLKLRRHSSKTFTDNDQAFFDQETEDIIAQKIAAIESLMKGNDNLRRQNRSLHAQVNVLKESLNKEKRQSAQIRFQIQQMEKLFKMRTFELESSKTELKYVIQKSNRQSINNILGTKGQLPEKVVSLLKKNHNMVNEKQKCDQGIQKDLQENHSFTNTFISTALETKPFFETRGGKHKRFNSFLANEREKNLHKFRVVQSVLKESLDEINSVLFKQTKQKKEGENKNKQEATTEEKKQIETLIKQQKYTQVIDKIKTKLNDLYQQSLKVNQVSHVTAKPSKGKKSVGSRISTLKNQVIHAHAWTQTQERKVVAKPSRTFLSPPQRRGGSRIQNRVETKITRRSKMQTVEGANDRLMNDQGIFHDEKKQRMVPISTLFSRFTESASKTVKQNFAIPEKTRYQSSRNRGGNRCSEIVSPLPSREQKKQKKQRYPSKFLQNSLFEQLNFENKMQSQERTRQLMEKALGGKKNKQNPRPSENQDNKQEQMHIVIHEEEKDSLMKGMDFVVKAAQDAHIYAPDDLKSREKYQDLLVGILRRASTVSKDIVSEAIQKYKSQNPSDGSEEEDSSLSSQ